MDNTVKNILIIFLMVLIFYLMSLLSSLLIPLVLAILFAVMFQPLVAIITKSKIPNLLIMPIIIIITLGTFWGIISLISGSISQIVQQQDYLLTRLDLKLNNILSWVNVSFSLHVNSSNMMVELEKIFDYKTISSAAGGIASGIGDFGGSFFMFAIYYVVLISGISNFENFIKFVAGNKEKKIFPYVEKIQKSIVKYMILKTGISLLTGFLAYLICVIFGIKFAILWGFLTFLLNFIPSIGSIVATIPPVLMALIQFDSIQHILVPFLCLSTIQFVIGNILEPKIMGKGLKINTLTVIFGLLFWGYIWGITGMLLSVPLLVIIKLVFEHIPSLSIVARLMGIAEKSPN